jgi:translation initiation factor RLI1
VAEVASEQDGDAKKFSRYSYPTMKKTQGAFSLTVEEGEFTDSEILVMLGENGTGKTTFIRMLHGSLKPDDESIEVPEFRVSYKPQKISPKFPGTVRPSSCTLEEEESEQVPVDPCTCAASTSHVPRLHEACPACVPQP